MNGIEIIAPQGDWGRAFSKDLQTRRIGGAMQTSHPDMAELTARKNKNLYRAWAIRSIISNGEILDSEGADVQEWNFGWLEPHALDYGEELHLPSNLRTMLNAWGEKKESQCPNIHLAAGVEWHAQGRPKRDHLGNLVLQMGPNLDERNCKDRNDIQTKECHMANSTSQHSERIPRCFRRKSRSAFSPSLLLNFEDTRQGKLHVRIVDVDRSAIRTMVYNSSKRGSSRGTCNYLPDCAQRIRAVFENEHATYRCAMGRLGESVNFPVDVLELEWQGNGTLRSSDR